MYSTLDRLTQDSVKGYIDNEEEAGKILDNVMKCKMQELRPSWEDETGNDTFLTLIKIYSYCEEETNTNTDKFLSCMNLADCIIEKTTNTVPWIKLFSAVTLDTLFSVYSQRSTQNIRHSRELQKLKKTIRYCSGLIVDNTTTVGAVLKAARSARKKAWTPDEDINNYTSKIRDCYSIIKAIIYDGPMDIYDVKNLDINTLSDVNNTDHPDNNSKEIA